MAYIGRDTDKISNVEVLDNITFDGSSSYTLQKGGSNFTPSSANTLLVSIDGVVQAGNFTVSGSTIDFGTAVAGTSTCDFILHYGIGLITSVSDGTITTAKLGDSAVTTAKLNDASVSLAKLTATGTKDATTFLRGDNTFAEAGGGIEMADQWRLTATTNAGVDADVTSNWERADNTGWGGIGTGLTESSGIFSFPSTGIYIINFTASKKIVNGDSTADYVLNITTDNSTYNQVALVRQGNHGSVPANYTASTNFLFDVTNTTNCKFKFETQSFGGNASTFLRGDTNINLTCFSVIRLGDT